MTLTHEPITAAHIAPIPTDTPWTLAALGAPALAFVVYGDPAPQGSKRHVGNGVMVESSKRVKPWRLNVTAVAIDATNGIGWAPLDGPLVADMVFTLPKPVSAPKRKRAWASKLPDLDKLMRATGDALTGLAYRDDSRIVATRRLDKVYVGDPDPDALRAPGAVIRLWSVES